jgi:DNA-binding NarL/FixJ family response regulator
MQEPTELLRVLVADDSKVVRERMAILLNEVPGVRVIGEAVNVPDTLAEVRRAQPAVLVLDLSMPGGSGLDVLRELQGQAGRPHTIVLTNYSFPEYEAEARRLGADAFLNKSTEFLKVAELVRELAERAPAQAQSSAACTT